MIGLYVWDQSAVVEEEEDCLKKVKYLIYFGPCRILWIRESQINISLWPSYKHSIKILVVLCYLV